MRRPSNDLRPMPGERLYRALLGLYPGGFRRRYGESMVEFYRDRWRAEAGLYTAWTIWREILVDLARTAIPERTTTAFAPRVPRRADPHVTEDTMGNLLNDLRYAVRGMVRRPGFTAVILATLGLGIGANAAIFSVVNGILLSPLPYRDANRIVAFQHEDPYSQVSELEFFDYKRDLKSFEKLAAFTLSTGNLTSDGEPERVSAARVSDGFFGILGVPAMFGRTFTSDEDLRGRPPVVVLSHGIWQRAFGGKASIVGRQIMLNGSPRTVVGVMPPHFDYPNPRINIWVPLRLSVDSPQTRNNHYLQLIGKLRAGTVVASARAEASTLDTRWTRDYPAIYFPGKPLIPRIELVRDAVVGSTRAYLFALLGAVALVLLIACVNVANLLLARGESRRKELAIRTALGASRRRVVSQLLTESGLLAVAGGLVGVVVAWTGVRLLVRAAPSTIPRLEDVRMDLPVLLFTLGISMVTGLLFGLVPALRAARGDTSSTLKEGGKTSTPGLMRGARGSLVVAEVTLAVAILIGAGMLVRSLRALQQTPLGFDPSSTLTMQLSLPRRYDDAAAVQLFRDVIERVEASPGVRSAAAMGWAPMAGEGGRWSIMVDGRVLKTIAEAPSPQPAQVTPGFFKTLGVTIAQGRSLTDADRGDAPMVAVVNEAMARQLWPGQNPIGHTFKMFNDQAPWVTVVGVARDMQSSGIRNEVPPTFFVPYAQAGKSAYYTPLVMTLAVKTTNDPVAATSMVRQIVRAQDRTIPISDVRTLDDVVGASIASRRFTTTLLTAFAALALVLAGIGIYGVIAYGVSQRIYEIGLRMALGAPQRRVMTLIMSEGLRLTLLGVVLGTGVGIVVARLIRSLLVGVSVVDVPTLIAAAAVLVGVAAAASALPARRAMRVSPTEALRNA